MRRTSEFPSTDRLSDALRSLRVRSSVFCLAEMREPWASRHATSRPSTSSSPARRCPRAPRRPKTTPVTDRGGCACRSSSGRLVGPRGRRGRCDGTALRCSTDRERHAPAGRASAPSPRDQPQRTTCCVAEVHAEAPSRRDARRRTRRPRGRHATHGRPPNSAIRDWLAGRDGNNPPLRALEDEQVARAIQLILDDPGPSCTVERLARAVASPGRAFRPVSAT
jgi:hypothetical protein